MSHPSDCATGRVLFLGSTCSFALLDMFGLGAHFEVSDLGLRLRTMPGYHGVPMLPM